MIPIWILIVLVCVIIFVFYYFTHGENNSNLKEKTLQHFNNVSEKNSVESVEDEQDLQNFSNSPDEKTNKLLNTNSFKSCDCPELATWHPGRISHKYHCHKFFLLNPGRTKQEFIKENEWFFKCPTKDINGKCVPYKK